VHADGALGVAGHQDDPLHRALRVLAHVDQDLQIVAAHRDRRDLRDDPETHPAPPGALEVARGGCADGRLEVVRICELPVVLQ
jgi:hypothetical protein